VVTTVGILHQRKGQHVLLHAIARLPADARPEIWLVGMGPNAKSLRTLATDLGIGELVMFFGRRDDIPTILSASDVYVQASLADPLPRARLEAMALGLPSIASAVDGIPEIITHEESGWLVPSGDPIALAEQLTNVLRDRERAQRVGTYAEQIVRARCSMDGMADAITNEIDRRFAAKIENRAFAQPGAPG
jgi:glycosyltransferase involved in cell wall biosynthesis